MAVAQPQTNFDRELTQVWETAARIGHSYQQDFSHTFTTLLLAMLESDGPTCRWFQEFAKSSGLDRARVLRHLKDSAASTTKDGVTVSVRGVMEEAELIRNSTAASTLAVRHVLASYIYRMPDNHLEYVKDWKFDLDRAATSFAGFLWREYQPEASSWDTLIRAATRGRVTVIPPRPSAPSSPPPAYRFSNNASSALRLATRLASQQRVKGRITEGSTITASALLFALVEFGRRRSSEKLAARLLIEDVRLQPNGDVVLDSMASEWLGTSMRDFLQEAAATKNVGDYSPNLALILDEALRLAREVSDSDEIAVRHLVVALLTVGVGLSASAMPDRLARLGINPRRVLEKLFDIFDADLAPEAAAWRRLVQFAPARGLVPDFLPDTDEGDDLLDVKADVEAFATVIASRDLEPPLSIGLFGDWGSGKSFFMRSLRERVAAIAVDAEKKRSSVFCSQIVQIPFNAWHYVDNNLWATLVSEIFEKLFAYIDENAPGGSKAEKRDEAAKRKGEIESELKKAEGLFQRARQTQQKAEDELETAKQRLAELLVKKTLPSVDDFRLLANQPEIKGKIADLEYAVGGKELRQSYDQVVSAVDDARSITNLLARLWHSLRHSPNPTWTITMVVLTLAAPLFLGWALHRWHVTFASANALAVQFLSAVTFACGVLAKPMKTVAAYANRVQRAFDAIKAAQQQREKAALQSLEEQEAAARAQVGEAEKKVIALRAELEQLQPGQLMKKFIRDRSTATDYQQHLGVVSLIRKDFDTLSTLLKEREELPVQRIVLYIDDLDRCPPRRVIEVLEAIHLLLAFRIFVVVVGVDARWISHSLVKKYPGLLRADSSPSAHAAGSPNGAATPHDYLEKIFQIPFWIRPMNEKTARKLVDGLARRSARSAPHLVDKPSTDAKPGTASTEGKTESSEVPVTTPNVRSSDQAPEDDSEKKSAPPIAPAPDPEKLTLDECEIKFMTALAAHIGRSPRRVKRFVNVYRIVKAGVPADHVASFIGPNKDGEYRSALTLLSLLTGSPNLAAGLLRRMTPDSPPTSWSTMKNALESMHGDAQETACALGTLSHYNSGDWRADELARWQTTLGRFSFRPLV